jgi:hypothetical protein
MDAQKHTPPGSVQPATDNQQTGAASNEGPVRVRAVTQCPTQNGDRGQITRSHTKERQRLDRPWGGRAVIITVHRPQRLPRWMQKLLPRLRTG